MPNTTDAAGATIDLMAALKDSLKEADVRRHAEPAIVAIKAVVAAGDRMAEVHGLVQEMADGRATEKSFAIRRLMGTVNEETGKPHSATSAEKVVETDAEYYAYRVQERNYEVERLRSIARFEAAKLSGALEVEIYKTLERVS